MVTSAPPQGGGTNMPHERLGPRTARENVPSATKVQLCQDCSECLQQALGENEEDIAVALESEHPRLNSQERTFYVKVTRLGRAARPRNVAGHLN